MNEPPPPYSAVQDQSMAKQGPPQDASSYPPQGVSYAPQGSGYPPPQQGGYSPQHGGYPPQHGGYPPPQGGYPPPQGGYPTPQGQVYPVGGAGGYTPVVTQQPATNVIVVTNVQYREVPVNTVCQFCNQQIVTRVSYKEGILTWLLCVGLCVFGCYLGCCLIPFCIDGCKDVLHLCPNCNRKVGQHSRI